MQVYKVLNQKAKNWWYYKELRKRGQHEEARKKERETILKEINDLRQAKKNGYFKKGLYGSSLYFKRGNTFATCEKHQCEKYEKLIIDLKIPFIDTSKLSLSERTLVCNLPIVKLELKENEKYIRDNGKYSSMAYVKLSTYKEILRKEFKNKVIIHNI